MLFKHIKQFVAPDILDIPVKLLLQFLLLALLTKQEFAIISLGMLFFSYSPFGQLGTLDYLMLKLPERYVSDTLLDSHRELALSRSIVNFVVLFFGICIVFFLIYSNQDFLLIIAFLAYIIQSFFYQKYLYRTIILRYSYNLEYLFKLKTTLSLTRLVFSTLGLYFFGIYGYLLSESFIYIVPIILFPKNGITNFSNSNSNKNIITLLKLSLPFLLVSIINLVSSQLDRWIIISESSLEIFADYSLCVFIITAILIVPGKINSMLIQYFREYFVTAKSKKTYYKNVIAYIQFSAIFLMILILISNYIIEYIIPLYLIKYNTILIYVPEIMILVFVRYIFNVLIDLIGLEFKQMKITFFKILFTVIFIVLSFTNEITVSSILNILITSTSLIILTLFIYLFRDFLFKLKYNLISLIVYIFLMLTVKILFDYIVLQILIFIILAVLTTLQYRSFYSFISAKSYLK
jgi:O-antigen/teichoic acid export membrane protein